MSERTRPVPKMRLSDIRRGPRVPVTVAEWDATPGLHEWIEGEIKRREEAACDATAGPWFAEHPEVSWGEEKDAEIIGQGKLLAVLAYERNGHLNADHIELNGPDVVLRRCAADRKILAAHPYMDAPDGVRSSREPCPTFACETCHVDDGYVRGGGNCDTVLALAEAYGLEAAGDDDVEVIRG